MSTLPFSAMRQTFVRNLQAMMLQEILSPAALAMKLGNPITENTIISWLNGTGIPTLYSYYQVCSYFHLDMGNLFDSRFDARTATGRSFARQSVDTPKITIEEPKEVVVEPVVEHVITTRTSSSSDVRIARKTIAELSKEVVSKRTASEKYNARLAYAIIRSGFPIKHLARQIGVPKSSLQGYMYYGISMPMETASRLKNALKTCNYATMGLVLDPVRKRFIALQAQC